MSTQTLYQQSSKAKKVSLDNPKAASTGTSGRKPQDIKVSENNRAQNIYPYKNGQGTPAPKGLVGTPAKKKLNVNAQTQEGSYLTDEYIQS